MSRRPVSTVPLGWLGRRRESWKNCAFFAGLRGVDRMRKLDRSPRVRNSSDASSRVSFAE